MGVVLRKGWAGIFCILPILRNITVIMFCGGGAFKTASPLSLHLCSLFLSILWPQYLMTFWKNSHLALLACNVMFHCLLQDFWCWSDSCTDGDLLRCWWSGTFLKTPPSPSASMPVQDQSWKTGYPGPALQWCNQCTVRVTVQLSGPDW